MRFVATAALVFTCLISYGCSGSPKIAPGESEYSYGNLRAVEAAQYDLVVKSAVTAMRKLQMKPMVRDKDSFRALVVGESVFGALAQSHEVRVHIEWLSDTTT